MSNPDEDKRMAEDSYRRTAAEGIANGIDRYFGSSDPSDDALVRISDYIPDVFVDLRYSGTDNFTGQVIYDFDDPLLKYGTVSKLMSVQRELNEYGFSLLIWDAFRPVSAQCRLWEVCPDPVYVADPEKGHSNHCRGNTVDVTLVTLTGEGVEMPSDFDNFSALADRDYGDVSEEAKENALLLESIMTANGFKGYYSEWWHFTDTVSYPVVEG
ncbi:MAG: hypothetical protein J5850_04985 [Clostridia bacterium]|nr:hypothetical protein [Clostridia bacterium]